MVFTKLTDQLQRNPLVVFFMFIIALLSGIITVVLGWSDFYNDYLSKEIVIPLWMLLLLGLIAAVFLIIKPTKRNKPKGLITVEGEKFGVQQIVVDGKRFVNCEFDGTELVFKGEQAFSLEGNRFISPPRIAFTEHAGDTVAVLKAFYNTSEFRPYVAKLFE